MADCNKNVYKSSGCDDFEVGDGNITFEQCGDRLGTISLDQCHDETIEIPCPCDGELSFSIDGKEQFTFTANQCADTVYNLDKKTLTDAINWWQLPFCSDCMKWCNEDGKSNDPCSGCRKLDRQEADDEEGCTDCGKRRNRAYARPESRQVLGVEATSWDEHPELPFFIDRRKLKLVKFWSEDCGICHKMSHYDRKVAEKLNIEFVSVPEMDDELWDEWVHVAEPLYEDTDGMGWPIYILVNHASAFDFEVWGEVKGGSDKGSFRRKILELIDDFNLTAREECTNGNGADNNGKHCVQQTCSTFKWDCAPDNVKVCPTGCYDIYWSSHGCNSCADDGGGTDLEYKVEIREPGGGSWKVVQDWSRPVYYTVRPKGGAQVGDMYEGRITGRCNDFPGGRRTINKEFTMVIKECKDGKPDDCKNDDDCPGDQVCKNGDCVDPTPNPPPPSEPDFPGDCNDGKCKNGWWLDMKCVYDKLGLGTVGVRSDYTAELERKVEYLEGKIAKFEDSMTEMIELRDVFIKSKIKKS